MMKCSCCNCEMPDERADFGFYSCSNCLQIKSPKGVMEYPHKTGGMLIIVDSDKVFKILKKPANQIR